MRRVYEVRHPGKDWQEIDMVQPNSVVGRRLTKPGEVWSDGYGWDYRFREVEGDD